MLISFKSFGQADVIIMIDNSGSITSEEFEDMRISIQNVIHNILNCNENRVAVVHYADIFPLYDGKIYIESDFSTDETFVSSFENRGSLLGDSDFAHESLGLIGKALDNVTDANIISTQKTLNRIGTNALVVYLFTDGDRNRYDSWLVNRYYQVPNTNLAFKNYTEFKNNRDAKFVVTYVSNWVIGSTLYNSGVAAAAAISTAGGSYTGTVESYPADPDGAGTTGRYLTNTGFDLNANQIGEVSDYICTLTGENCPRYLTYTSPDDDIETGNIIQKAYSYITASNIINAGADYGAGDYVTLTDGFYATDNSVFFAHITECESSDSAQYASKISSKISNKSLGDDSQALILSPNPATQNVTLTLAENIKSVSVGSLDGKTIFYQELSGTDTVYKLDLNNYNTGIYFVSVIDQNGKVTTERLIVQ